MGNSHASAVSQRVTRRVYSKKWLMPKATLVCPQPRQWCVAMKPVVKASGGIAVSRRKGAPTRWWIPPRLRSTVASCVPVMGWTPASCGARYAAINLAGNPDRDSLSGDAPARHQDQWDMGVSDGVFWLVCIEEPSQCRQAGLTLAPYK